MIEMENPTQIIREILVRQQIISTALVILMAVMAGLAGWILWEAARDRRRREREQREQREWEDLQIARGEPYFRRM